MWILKESHVRQVLDADLAIEAVEKGLRALSGGDAIQPVRTVMVVKPSGNFLGLMPAQLVSDGHLGVKLVNVGHNNVAKGLTSHLASILLFSPETGETLALVDGRLITEVRTAAASAVSAGLLSREDSGVLAILGAGVQAHSHLECLPRVRKIREARIYARSPEKLAAFVKSEAAGYDFPVVAAASADAAVRGADIIVTATASHEPVLLGEWLSPGQHICAVGACVPNARELDGKAVARCRVWVDSRGGAEREAGDLILARAEGCYSDAQLVGELGEALLGKVPSRTRAEEITLFKSLGVAVEDVATASLVLERAREQGLGSEFEL